MSVTKTLVPFPVRFYTFSKRSNHEEKCIRSCDDNSARRQGGYDETARGEQHGSERQRLKQRIAEQRTSKAAKWLKCCECCRRCRTTPSDSQSCPARAGQSRGRRNPPRGDAGSCTDVRSAETANCRLAPRRWQGAAAQRRFAPADASGQAAGNRARVSRSAARRTKVAARRDMPGTKRHGLSCCSV